MISLYHFEQKSKHSIAGALKMKRKYYALFSCDEWKSYSSEGFRGIFTLRELKKQVRKELRNKTFEYDGSIRDITDISVKEIHDNVTYLSITPLSINKEL